MALFLREKGYPARALTGGYAAWREADYPIEPKAVEMQRQAEGELCAECGRAWNEHAA